MYLMYKGPSDDGLQRSDLIKKCNVIDVRLTAAADQKHIMKKVEVTLNSAVSATPIVGQDYVLNVDIKNYIALGDDSTKTKFGAAHAFNTTASDLYKALAINLAKNFSREPAPLVSIALKTASDPVPVTNKTTMASITGTTATGIIIEEVAQPWRRGAAPFETVNFEVIPSTIYTGGADQVWGTVTDVTASNTNYLSNSYTFIDIHYYFEGNSHNIGKSEKTLTIVVPGKASDPEQYAQKLLGVATPGSETGLYAFLKGTGTPIRTSPSWDAA